MLYFKKNGKKCCLGAQYSKHSMRGNAKTDLYLRIHGQGWQIILECTWDEFRIAADLLKQNDWSTHDEASQILRKYHKNGQFKIRQPENTITAGLS